MRDDLVIGVAMVKDEADIIRASVANMLRQVDHVIVADNLSSDGTTEILMEMQHGQNLTVLDDREVGYWQSRKMTDLAHRALDLGARWVVPFDADEIWVSRWGTVAEVLRGCDPDYGIVLAELFDHMVTGADDPTISDPVARIGWRRTAPLELPKVACRALPGMVIEQGNHYARYPAPLRPTEQARLTVHHYPYRSVEQMIRKVRNGAAAYAETSLPPTAGQHWRQWGTWSDEQIAEAFHVWYYRPDPPAPIRIGGDVLDGLIWDPPEPT